MTTQTPAIEERVSRLEGAYEQVNERPSDLTQALATFRSEMNERLSEINSRFNTMLVLLGALGRRRWAVSSPSSPGVRDSLNVGCVCAVVLAPFGPFPLDGGRLGWG